MMFQRIYKSILVLILTMSKKKKPSINEMREKSQAPRGGLVYKFVDYLAYYPAKLFLYLPITPNQITFLWIAIQIISTFFLIKGEYWTTIVALLVFQSMFILDCTDGIVARYKKQFSIKARFLDDMGHFIANSCLLIFFTLGVYQQYRNPIYLLFGLIAVVSFLLNKASTLNPIWCNEDQVNEIIKTTRKCYPDKQNKWVLGAFNFLRLEHFGNLLFWGVVFGVPQIVLIVYGLIYFLELLRKLISQYLVLGRIDKKNG